MKSRGHLQFLNPPLPYEPVRDSLFMKDEILLSMRGNICTHMYAITMVVHKQNVSYKYGFCLFHPKRAPINIGIRWNI